MDTTLPAIATSRDPALAPLRIMLTYVWRHGRLPDLARPARFTELVQHRKLHDRDARMAMLADKVRVKTFAAAALGEAWITPTLWHGAELPVAPQWPYPFVIKARHGCNQTAFVHTEPADWPAIRARTRRWMDKAYGGWLDEWGYRHVPRGILIEPFIGTGPALPIDYKCYVFGGRAAFVQVHLGRGARHRWIVMDADWRRVSSPTRDADPPRPAALAEMIGAAERLGRGFDFVRVDLYDVAGRPRFGEMTFYPGSGLDRFDPVSLDQVMGDHWRRARDGGTLYPPNCRRSAMGMLDGLLGQVAANIDIKNLAEKIGLTPDQVEQAVAALGQAHPQPGDTVTTAAENTGLPTDKLQEIVGHLGGEGALGKFASLLGEQGGAGGLLGGLSGMFGKN